MEVHGTQLGCVIKHIDIQIVQMAVAKAYIVLVCIPKSFAGHQTSPGNIQGMSTASVAASVAFATFCCRKKECQDTQHDYV